MADTKLELEKALQENYSAVQKKEISIYEEAEKLKKDFTTKTNASKKGLQTEISAHKKKDREIKAAFKQKVKEETTTYNNNKKEITAEIKKVNEDYIQALQKNQKELDDFKVSLDKAVEELVIAYEQVNENAEQNIAKLIEESNKLIVTYEKKQTKESTSTAKKLQDIKDQYEAKIVTLSEKYESKRSQAKEANDKKVAKLQDELSKIQEKVENELADKKPVYDEKLTSINAKIKAVEDEYEKRTKAVKTTKESKVARHEKFMKRAEQEGDNRGAKSHRNDIKALEKQAAKDLRLLEKDYNDKLKGLSFTKEKLIKDNLESIFQLEKDFISFKETKSKDIKLLVSLGVKGLADLVLEEETKKFEEFVKLNNAIKDLETKESEFILEIAKNIQTEKHKQEIEQLAHERNTKERYYGHKIELKTKEKEAKQAAINKDKADSLEGITKEVALEKLNHQQAVADATLNHNKQILSKEELIEYHQNDFEKQSSYKNEFLDYQQELTNLQTLRAKELYDYELLELKNRVKLKTTVIQKFQTKVTEDFDLIVSKINEVYEQEKALYEVEIKEASDTDLAELEGYKQSKQMEINQVIEKKDSLDAKAYRKEIRQLEMEIKELEDEYEQDVARMETAIKNKTRVFEKALADSENRKNVALNEADKERKQQLELFANALDVLTSEEETEENNINKRYENMQTSANNIFKYGSTRNSMQTEENINYMDARVNKEKAQIEEIKNALARTTEKLSTNLDDILKKLENDKQAHLARVQEDNLAEEKELESYISDMNAQLAEHNRQFDLRQKEYNNKNEEALNEIDRENRVRLHKISTTVMEKEQIAKQKLEDQERVHDQAIQAHQQEEKQIHRESEDLIKKETSLLQVKLQNDLKSI